MPCGATRICGGGGKPSDGAYESGRTRRADQLAWREALGRLAHRGYRERGSAVWDSGARRGAALHGQSRERAALARGPVQEMSRALRDARGSSTGARMTKTGAITGPKHFTAAEAQLNGLIKPGEAWDEATQKAIPRGEALEIAQLERPLDLAQQLATYQRNRKTLANFVRQYLEEAEYDARGNLVPGKLRDYYHFPGAPKAGPNALTKHAAEKVGQLYRYGRGVTRTVDKTETAEYTAATSEGELIDQYRRPIASGVGSCPPTEGGLP